MNYRRRALTISLLMHGTMLFLVFALSSTLAGSIKPVVIDFTLVEPNGAPPPPAETPRKRAETPVITKSRPIQRQPKQRVAPPEPATDTRGTVPVFAKPKESPPAPAAHPSVPASDAVTGGTGTSVAAKGTGSGSGKSESTEQLRSRYRAEHFAYIKKIIEENLSYPPRAQRMGWSGRVVVAFEVLNSGKVQNIRIAKSTGYEVLDENVVETIRKVEPFPKPPVPVKLTIPFTYGLE
jgi:protein TonB